MISSLKFTQSLPKIAWNVPSKKLLICTAAAVCVVAISYTIMQLSINNTHVDSLYQVASSDGEEHDPALLLLFGKIAILRGFLCTICIYCSRAIFEYFAYTLAVICLPYCLRDLARRYIQARNNERALMNAIRETIVDQFAECKKCAHKANCPKSSPEKLREVVLRCERELGIDFFELQQEARIYLRKTAPSGVLDAVKS